MLDARDVCEDSTGHVGDDCGDNSFDVCDCAVDSRDVCGNVLKDAGDVCRDCSGDEGDTCGDNVQDAREASEDGAEDRGILLRILAKTLHSRRGMISGTIRTTRGTTQVTWERHFRLRGRPG